ncbi:MAG: hypothetical protein ABR568_01820 [Pyrinomonadaceae bacterium]
MTNQDIENKIAFIIEHQAQFVVDIQALREAQAVDSAFMRESYQTITGAGTTIISLVGRLAETQERTDANVAKLAQALTRTDATVAELAERVNLFIDVVERYISRNGKEGSEGRT